MVDAVNTVVGGNAVATPSQQAVSLSSTLVDSSPKVETTSSKSGTNPQGFSYTNRLYHDPISGLFINEQLDAHGHIVSQSPRDTTLAYLRNGVSNDTAPQKTVTA